MFGRGSRFGAGAVACVMFSTGSVFVVGVPARVMSGRARRPVPACQPRPAPPDSCARGASRSSGDRGGAGYRAVRSDGLRRCTVADVPRARDDGGAARMTSGQGASSGAGVPDPAKFSRLMRPRSIAVIGGREAARVAEQCDRMGFDGALWPVHPEHATVARRPAFQSVAELPGVPDAAFVAVNRHATVEVVAALARAGAAGPSATPRAFSNRTTAECCNAPWSRRRRGCRSSGRTATDSSTFSTARRCGRTSTGDGGSVRGSAASPS